MSNKKLNYVNPSIITLMSRMVKYQNNELLERFGQNYNYTNKQIDDLKKKYIKLNHIYPNVVQKKNREYLQCLLIKDF
jgi:hypothetical protein